MILFVFICKRFFHLISFIWNETKLKGHDGIAVYTSLHFSADFIGNFSAVGETHVDGGCHWRCYRERINGSFMFLVEIFHDAAINVWFGISISDQHAFNVHEFHCVWHYMCWRFYKPGQVIQTQDFFFGGVEWNLSNACRDQNEDNSCRLFCTINSLAFCLCLLWSLYSTIDSVC